MIGDLEGKEYHKDTPQTGTEVSQNPPVMPYNTLITTKD